MRQVVIDVSDLPGEGTSLHTLRKVLSVLLAAVLVPVLWFQMGAHTIRSLLVDPVSTKHMLRESGLYIRMEKLLVQQVMAGVRNPQNPVPFTQEEISTLVNRVLPPSRLQGLVETAVDGFYQWFLSDMSRPTITLDLSEVRLALPGALRQVIEAKVEALPVCTAAQAAQLASTYKGGIPPCKSPVPSFNRTVIDRALTAAQIEKLIPAQVDLAAELEARNGIRFWKEIDKSVRNARTALFLIPRGWAVVAALLALLALLNLDRWHTPFRWLAAPLLAGGGLMFLASWLGVGYVLALVGATTGSPVDELTLSVARVALETAAATLRNLSMFVSLVGLGSLVIAVAGYLSDRAAGGSGQRAIS